MANEAAPTLDDINAAIAAKQAPVAQNSQPSLDDINQAIAAKQSQQPQRQYSPEQTAIEHFGNGIAMGYGPQLQAASEKVMFPILKYLTGKDVEAEDYVTARDRNTKRMALESQQNPKTALTSEVAGALTGGMATPLPGFMTAKGIAGAATSGKVLKAIGGGVAKGGVTGLTYGALSNPGDVEGVYDPLQLDLRGENAKKGGVIGMVTGGATQALSGGARLLKAAPQVLQEAANAQSVKASGAMLKDFRSLEGADRTQVLGKFALDKGLVKVGDTFEDVGAKAEALRQNAGERLDSLYKQAAEAMPAAAKSSTAAETVGFNPIRDKSQILSAIKDKLGDQEGASGAVKRIETYLDELGTKYGNKVLDPKTANNIESAVAKKVNFLRNPLTASPEAEQAFSVLRSHISDAVDNHVEYLSKFSKDPQAAVKLAEANRDYGMAKQVANMANDKAQRLLANSKFGLLDTLAAGGGAATGAIAGEAMGDHPVGGAIAGIGAGILSKYGRKYGDAALARGLHVAGKVMGSGPSQLAGVTNRVLTPAIANALTRTASQYGTANGEINPEDSLPTIQDPRVSFPTQNQPPKQDRNPAGYSEGGYVRPNDQTPPDPRTVAVIDPQKAKQVQDSMRKAFNFDSGGRIPGTPKVPYNSPQNDTTFIKATPGEVVLPLSVTQSTNPDQAAANFMRQQQMPQPGQPNPPPSLPSKGPEKWSADGFQKLKSHVSSEDRKFLDENKTAMLLDPQAKRLLITASSYSPGSKPLDQVLQHLKNKFGEGNN